MSNERIKEELLTRIADGRTCHIARGHGPSKWYVGETIVHMRFCSRPKTSDGVTYAYNINPNTLRADYEIWICGEAGVYYCIPTEVMKAIYRNPEGYVDRRHPEIRVAEVDTRTHQALYARGGQHLDFSPYFRATLTG